MPKTRIANNSTTREYRDDELVAVAQGASFTADEYPVTLYGAGKLYVIEFDNDPDVELVAIDDDAALAYAHRNYREPFSVAERITTWREVYATDA